MRPDRSPCANCGSPVREIHHDDSVTYTCGSWRDGPSADLITTPGCHNARDEREVRKKVEAEREYFLRNALARSFPIHTEAGKTYKITLLVTPKQIVGEWLELS